MFTVHEEARIGLGCPVFNRSRQFVLALFACLTLPSCLLGPDYERPEVLAPSNFRFETKEKEDSSSLADVQWWGLFKDKELQELIRRGLLENKDLRLAVARVKEARAQVGVTRSNQFPTLVGNAGAFGNQASGAVAQQFGGPPGLGDTSTQFRAVIDLAFEVDIWGKLRRSTEAAQADLLAQEWTRQTVMLTLVSDIAQAYFQLRDLDLELEIAKRTLESREESVKLIKLRKLMGMASALDLRRAEREVARAAAVIPGIERQIGQVENQLSILVGRNPGFVMRGQLLTEQAIPPEVPAGLPSALLERRPDIQQAEHALIAANARIGVARAAFFPQIRLTGFYGAQSVAFSDLFTAPARVWRFGPEITLPMFNAGRLRSDLEVTDAQQEQALITYEQTIQQAFREVEDALIAYHKAREVRSEQEVHVKVSRDALQLARFEYLNGVATYLDVLESQRELFQAEIALTLSQRDQLVAMVQLYKALGGGWAPEQDSENPTS